MTQQEVVDYLIECGCVVVRVANQRYYVMRNPIGGEMSGVPVATQNMNGHLRNATVCQICDNLNVPRHDGIGGEAAGAIDLIRQKHLNSGGENP